MQSIAQKNIPIQLLGPLSIGAPEGHNAPGPKTQALLAYLAVRPQAHRRQQLCELFCASADDPAGALRWHLSRLRHWLGADLLRVEDERVRLNFAAVAVDSAAFEQALQKPLREQPLGALSAAIDLYRGEFLAGMSLPDAPELEIWLLAERARLHDLYERGLNELIQRLSGESRFEDALVRAQQLVQANPLLEQAHAHLIWLYAHTGRRQAALQQYIICRDYLRRELAVEPTAELEALRQSVLAGRVGPRSDPAPAEERDWRQSPDFVGRDAELSQLQSVWNAAHAGRGRVVLVAAEAGGGKTRLVQEFTKRLTADGATLLAGQCFESTRALPYYPWIEVLELCLSQRDASALLQLAPFWREQLSRLLPALSMPPASRPGAAPPTAGLEVEHLFGAVHAYLLESTDEPLCICIDDLQWADEASLRLLHYLARRSAAHPALLVGTFRPEDAHDSPALLSLLGDLRRGGALELRLPPLGLDAITALTARLWQRLPQEARPQVSAQLTQATGGNPLFVTEVLRELAHRSEMPHDVPVPAGVRELIQHRLGTLPDSTRQVFEAIAVVDMPVTVAQAQKLSARSEAETIAAIDRGLRTGLLRAERAAHSAQYGFSHELLREAAASLLSDVRRRLLHRRAAGLLAQQAARTAPVQRSELAGRILRHALAGDELHLVLTWAPVAAEHAKRLGAYTGALAGFEAASGALARLRETSAAGDEPERQELALLLNRVELLYRLSRRAETGALLEQAAGLLPRVADARLAALFHLREAAYLVSVNAYDRAYAAAQRAYEQHVQLADSLHAAEALHVASDARQSRGDPRDAIRLAQQSLELYRSAGDERAAGRLLAEVGWALLDRGEIDTALARLSEAEQIAEQQHDIFLRAYSSLVLSLAWNYYYRAEQVRAYALQAQQLFRAIGNDAAATRASLMLGTSDYGEGRTAQARETLRHTLDEARARGDGWLEGWAAQVLGRVALHEGELAGAERWLTHAYQLRRAHQEENNVINDLAWMGRLRLAQRRPADALDYTREAVERSRAIQAQSYVWEQHDVLLAHAEALSACGSAAEALPVIQSAYAELMRLAGQIGDAQVRAGFLDYPLSVRVTAAWQRGSTTTYPDP